MLNKILSLFVHLPDEAVVEAIEQLQEEGRGILKIVDDVATPRPLTDEEKKQAYPGTTMTIAGFKPWDNHRMLVEWSEKIENHPALPAVIKHRIAVMQFGTMKDLTNERTVEIVREILSSMDVAIAIQDGALQVALSRAAAHIALLALLAALVVPLIERIIEGLFNLWKRCP